uniref:Uncharacterized protein n=1 Tax=Trichobilharzia regenti TaxID=157069 RepID=A0AA85KEH1_TRIRE|nr:unnamed protein product [Trichobilharzia regenti]
MVWANEIKQILCKLTSKMIFRQTNMKSTNDFQCVTFTKFLLNLLKLEVVSCWSNLYAEAYIETDNGLLSSEDNEGKRQYYHLKLDKELTPVSGLLEIKILDSCFILAFRTLHQ